MKIMLNALSIDVEEWFHICDIPEAENPANWKCFESTIVPNVNTILSILNEYDVKATFFVLGYIAKTNPELITKIQEHGHEISIHGYYHKQVYKQNKESFREDLFKSKQAVEDIIGEDIIGYRAPEWSIREDSFWAIDILCEQGFKYDSSINPVRIIGKPDENPYPHLIKNKKWEIIEFPPTMLPTFMGNIPIGGGWGLRLMPYVDIKNRIKQLNKKNIPALIYLHPWEIDLQHPKLGKTPFLKNFVCYAGIRNARTRLEKLMSEFSFGSIREVLKI